MQLTESNKVHLDHLIHRLSIRYFEKEENVEDLQRVNRNNDPYIRYNDIRGEWFEKLKKPDFQRETNAWSPTQCKDFIESVVLGRIIPSIILWKSQENGVTYILDGAHRLSVIRAWMIDDWGDKAGGYYERRDSSHIRRIASETRDLISRTVGSFDEFKTSYNNLQKLIQEGEAPKKRMTSKAFEQASFYSEVIGSNSSLYAQYETGNYDSAEQSFLRINRQGQALDPWEATLIEYRKGSYSRSIMHIANGGENGHYWPNHNLGEIEVETINTFPAISKDIYTKLFVPPFELPIQDLTVPILVAPAYFQKHLYLLELIPLIVWNKIALDSEEQIELLSKDYQSSPEVVVNNAKDVLYTLNEKIEHLVSTCNNPLSLSLVPLIYWYNHRGQFLRSLLYGFISWILEGSTEDIRKRKIIFSANRKKVEYVLFNYKQEIAALAAKYGAGLKATKAIAGFYDELIYFLNESKDIELDSPEINQKILDITQQKKASKSIKRSGRTYTQRDKSQSNINELFDSSIRCHICGGIVNLKFGGIQYDHVQEFRNVNETDPENMKPTHPFCNNNRNKIEKHRSANIEASLPKRIEPTSSIPTLDPAQLSFWGLESDFPI